MIELSMKNPFIFMTCFIAITQITYSQEPVAGTELKVIIANIAANESLYNNLDFQRIDKYSYVLPEYLKRSGRSKENILKKREIISHYVFQDGMYSLQQNNTGLTDSNRKTVHNIRNVCDGVRTLQVSDLVVNIHNEKVRPNLMFKPHMFILGRIAKGASLTEFLSCKKVGEYNLNVIYETEELVQGNMCHRLRVETWSDGQKRRDFWLLWIDPNRNYIPVRGVGYALGYSGKIPLEIVDITNWNELSPKIWFPFKINRVVNDERSAAQEETVVSNTTTSSMSDVSLEPDYKKEYFQDVNIPDKAVVYELRAGEIVNSYQK